MKELRLHGELIVTGVGSLSYIEGIECSRAFIVTGEGSTFRNGTIDTIKGMLDKNGCKYEVYSGIKKNPTTSEVIEGVTVMRSFVPDMIIAVGGGSAIDAAKSMTLFYEYPGLSFDKALNEPLPQSREKLRFIAIPTTSGTATEVTRVSVITYKDSDLKIGLKSNAFIPDVAILDAGLTLSMPKNVVAETGMDAMTHAVECYINTDQNDYSECLASGAVEGLFRYLPLSYEKGTIEYREKVHNYQCIAGSAFANVGLGMAHGISHAIGGRFNYGHGLLNAVVLPYVLQFNSRDEHVKERLQYLASRVGAGSFIDAIKQMNKRLSIPDSFKEMGITGEDFDQNFDILVTNSLKGSTRVNPVKISQEEMKRVLQYIYEGKDIDF
ncbi:MAG TPA: iron-containing alcohol dehydrogenase [Clostridia bacterium]|nr:iron-containing alcohol dehydrogenase [Clostridia bacterium]